MAEAGPVREEIVVFDKIGHKLRSWESGNEEWKVLTDFDDVLHGDPCTFSAVAARDTLYVLAWRRWVFCIKPYEEEAKWTKKPSTKEGHGGCPPAASVGDQIYVCGGGWERAERCYTEGWAMHAFSSVCEKYDPQENIWTPIADMKTARRLNSLVVTNGDLYCIGGVGKRRDDDVVPPSDETMDVDYVDVEIDWKAGEELAEVERYNVETDEWTNVAPMNAARVAPAVVAKENAIYALGRGYRYWLNIVERYDIETNKWTDLKTSMISRRFKFRACIIGSHIYAVGGDGNEKLGRPNTVERYNLTEESEDGAWGKVDLLHGMNINNMATVVMTRGDRRGNRGQLVEADSMSDASNDRDLDYV